MAGSLSSNAARAQGAGSLLSVATTTALVVDVQEVFRPHIHGFSPMVAAIRAFLEGCRLLEVPIAATEQYPEGLGATVPELAEVLDGAPIVEKFEISACRAPDAERLQLGTPGERTIAIAGIETHVCVSQTVHDLLGQGYAVHVLADCVGSRDPWQREMALERMARAGATISTMEAALFELLECAGTQRFKNVQRVIKQHDSARLAATAGAA